VGIHFRQEFINVGFHNLELVLSVVTLEILEFFSVQMTNKELDKIFYNDVRIPKILNLHQSLNSIANKVKQPIVVR